MSRRCTHGFTGKSTDDGCRECTLIGEIFGVGAAAKAAVRPGCIREGEGK